MRLPAGHRLPCDPTCPRYPRYQQARMPISCFARLAIDESIQPVRRRFGSGKPKQNQELTRIDRGAGALGKPQAGRFGDAKGSRGCEAMRRQRCDASRDAGAAVPDRRPARKRRTKAREGRERSRRSIAAQAAARCQGHARWTSRLLSRASGEADLVRTGCPARLRRAAPWRRSRRSGSSRTGRRGFPVSPIVDRPR